MKTIKLELALFHTFSTPPPGAADRGASPEPPHWSDTNAPEFTSSELPCPDLCTTPLMVYNLEP